MTDGRVLDALAAQLERAARHRRRADASAASWAPCRRPAPTGPAAPSVAPAAVPQPGRRRGGAGHLAPPDRPGHACIDGDEHLAGTARPPVVRLGKGTAEALGVADGDPVTVGTDRGAITLPAAITEMPDGVVWLPTNSPGSTVRRSLGATSGAVVRHLRRSRSPRRDRGGRGPLLNAGGVA